MTTPAFCSTCGLALCDHRDDEWSSRILTDDDIRTIRFRAHGWEGASTALLAKVFGVSHQKITAVLRDNPGVPGK